jgi:hypothetical protein
LLNRFWLKNHLQGYFYSHGRISFIGKEEGGGKGKGRRRRRELSPPDFDPESAIAYNTVSNLPFSILILDLPLPTVPVSNLPFGM